VTVTLVEVDAVQSTAAPPPSCLAVLTVGSAEVTVQVTTEFFSDAALAHGAQARQHRGHDLIDVPTMPPGLLRASEVALDVFMAQREAKLLGGDRTENGLHDEARTRHPS